MTSGYSCLFEFYSFLSLGVQAGDIVFVPEGGLLFELVHSAFEFGLCFGLIVILISFAHLLYEKQIFRGV